MQRLTILALVAALLGTTTFATPALACPFCAAVSQTFSQEIESMDVAVIAKLTKLPPPRDPSVPSDQGTDIAKATFEVVQVLKGKELLNAKQPIETLYFGEGSIGKEFVIMAVRETPESARLQWTTPLLLSERGKEYILKLTTLPKEGHDRLAFFQNYLEDKDEMLARDSYDEFANAPYESVKSLKGDMNHEQLVKWIQDENIPASRRRLYLTMLGVCGTPADLPMLETMLKAEDRKAKAGLDAMIACYLTLKGEAGVQLIEDLYIANAASEYADTYSAIMALRFHGTEGDVVPKARIVKAVRQMLKRPQLADLVIPDLARWQDWEAMDELVALFKNADEKSSWVRVPVVNYLRACPLPKAKEHLAELEKIDPQAVKRANQFFPFGGAGGGGAPAPTNDKASDANSPAKTGLIAAVEPSSKVTTKQAAVSKPKISRVKSSDAPTLNLWTVVCVPWVFGLVLMLAQWGILRGAR
ncbi:MAG TPA: hypothetical protein VL096_03635 [Pirellulaceae bacterium]|nr:hypothetical protein [Pirellulaceae bacterium]